MYNLHSSKHASKVIGAPRLVEEVVLLEDERTGAFLGYLVGSCEPNWAAANDDYIVRLVRHNEFGFCVR